MSIVTYNKLPQIDRSLNTVLTDNGYMDINSAPFLKQFVNVIKEATKGQYSELYSIASNIDIGRASGQYLDRWGRFMSQARTMISYASDMSLNNVEIYISGTGSPKAAEITIDAGDIVIPSGTKLSSADGSYSFRTIDSIKISGDRNSVFARVISEKEGYVYLPTGYLTDVALSLTEISNIMPMAVTKYKLKCTNNKEITGGTNTADDTTYRYILQETAASIGLSNERKINLLYDIEDVYDIKAVKFRGGISVFIDATDITNRDQVVQAAKNYVKNMNFGMPIYCFPPVTRKLSPTISLIVKTKDNLDTSFTSFKTTLAAKINSSKMGTPINIQSMVDEIITTSPNLMSGSMKIGYLGGRQVLGSTIPLLFNERIYVTTDDITVVVS